MDRNQHVKDYLEYYINFPKAPHFAVLLNGPWGIGKTFLVEEFMKSLATTGLRYVRVSLYGLTSFEEVDDALFRAMYPVLENKGVQLVGRTAKMIGKHFGWSSEFELKDILDKAKSDVFIFDDLERCAMPVSRVLGYINEFIEREDRKVIIIANEEELDGGEEYARIREKLVGKTFEIQSVLEQALAAFNESIRDEKARSFLGAKSDVISEIYNQSELHNLRILQQAMWDFERLYISLDEKHRNNDAAMKELLRLLFALSFELKAARLKPDELKKRQSFLIASLMRDRGDGEKGPSLATARQRYPEVNLGTTTLSDETVVDLLIKGIVDGAQIRAELDASSFFITVGDEPAWRTVWHAFERTEEEFNEALSEMERAFAAREYALSGEILHVFGLRLWLSKIGAVDRSREQVVAEAKSYIDDLYKAGRIEPASPHEGFTELRFGGYGGLGIHESETSEYHEFFQFFRTKRQAAFVDKYPAIAEGLLTQMTADLDQFVRRITLTYEGGNEFYNIPVLASVDPSKFVSIILGEHPALQRTVLNALRSRYEDGKIDRELAEERSWVVKVRDNLYEAAENMSPLSKDRIRKSLHYSLDQVLGLDQETAS